MKKTIKLFAFITALTLCITLFSACAVDPENCEHDYKLVETVDSTCEAFGKEVFKCSKCNDEKEEVLPLDHTNHTVSSDWSYDETTHYHQTLCNHEVYFDQADHVRGEENNLCTVCGYDMGCEHEWSSTVTKEPTCTNLGVRTYTCSKCEDVREEDIAIDPEKHVFSLEWAGDKENHWKQAVCGHDITIEFGEHVEGEDESCTVCGRSMACVHEWKYEVETESTCSTLGVIKKTCYFCKTVEYTNITYDEDKHLFYEEWASDADNHWHPALCTHSVVDGLAPHVYEDGACVDCSYECKHSFDKGVYDKENKKTTYVCNICGKNKVENGLPNRSSELIITNTAPEEGSAELKYYKYKLDIDPSEDGNLIQRREYKTFYQKDEIDLITPSNDDFTYTGNLLSKEIYEKAYAFDMEKVCKKVFGTAEFNAREFNKMVFNFMRFIYISTDGAVELSFEYDTSFMYQVRGMKLGYRGRFVVESVKEGFTAADTVNALLNSAYSGNATYLQTYSNIMKFKVSFLDFDDTTTGLKVGDYSWCDIEVGIPLLAVDTENNFWSFMLTNSGMIKY